MFSWLKLKWKSAFNGKKNNFKRDDKGHAIANRFDVDDKPNEPQDFATPPIRLPKDKKSRAALRDLLKGQS